MMFTSINPEMLEYSCLSCKQVIDTYDNNCNKHMCTKNISFYNLFYIYKICKKNTYYTGTCTVYINIFNMSILQTISIV